MFSKRDIPFYPCNGEIVEKKYEQNLIVKTVAVLALLILLYILSRYSYLAFHTLAEVFSVIVAFGLFMIAWNSSEFNKNNYFLFLGIAYLFIGSLDLIHAMAYRGMNIFSGYDANLPTQLWIGTRFIESITLLCAPFVLGKKFNRFLIISLYAFIFAVLVITSFAGIFPVSYIEGAGLTNFKVVSEYVISFILLIALYALYKKRDYFTKHILKLLYASIILTILSEISFTCYINVYGISNFVGHILKLFSFYLIYKALIEEGLKKPYISLFKEYEKSEQRYYTIFEATGTATLIVDEDTTILNANKTCEIITGYKVSDLIGKSWTSFVVKEDLELMLSRHAQRRKEPNSTPKMYEVRLTDAKGEIRNSMLSVDMIPDSKKSIVSMIDITQRKKAEAALKESEQKYRFLFNHQVDGAFVLDAETMKIELANKALRNIFGVGSDEDIIGRNPLDFIVPEDRERLTTIISEDMFKNDLHEFNEFRSMTQDGRVIWINAVGVRTIFKGKLAGLISVRDITMHKDMLDRLKNSEEYYRTIFESTGTASLIVENDATIIGANRQCEDIAGYRTDELIGKKWIEFVAKESLFGLKKFILRLKKIPEKHDKKYKIAFYNKAGQKRQGTIHIGMIPDTVHSIVSIIDNTDLIEVTKRNLRLAETVRRATDGIVLTTPQGKVVWANPSYEAMTGYSLEELINEDLSELIESDVSLAVGDEIRKSVICNGSWDGDLMCRRKNGEVYPVRSTVFGIKDEAGTLLEIAALQQDITERKKAVLELQESEERFRSLVTNLPVGVFRSTLEGKILSVNPAMVEIYGYDSVGELLKVPASEYYPIKDTRKKMLTELEKEGYLLDYKTQEKRKDGSLIWVSTTYKKILNEDDGRYYIDGVVADITERKQAEKIQKTLFNISNALNTVDNIEELYCKIRKFLGDIIDTTNFFVAMYDENTDTISIPFHVDKKDEFQKFPAGKTLAKYVIKSGKSLLANNEVVEELIKKGLVENIGANSEIWLGVPLIIDKKVIGLLAVQSYDDPHLYTEKDIEILTFVSEEIALAIKHKQTDEEMGRELKEKTLLLQEVHHRTKNNLQTISSLLQLQQDKIETKEDAIKSFEVSQDRIRTIAQAYEILLSSEYMSEVTLNKYIISITEQLQSNYDIYHKIRITYDLEKAKYTTEGLHKLGLIVNEILTNAMKYAFVGRDKGHIHIGLKNLKDDIEITLSDDGVGIPEEVKIPEPTTLGLSLVDMLLSEFNGTYTLDRTNGTSFKLRLPKSSQRN